jgi:hypothetical protein
MEKRKKFKPKKLIVVDLYSYFIFHMDLDYDPYPTY